MNIGLPNYLTHAFSLIDGPLPIFHQGPDLSYGPLPAFFYFALAGDESLTLDPYNQPVAFLAGSPIRIFSFTLPGHGPQGDKKQALQHWTVDVLDRFLNECSACIDFLIEKKYIQVNRIAAGGLSRGAFIATHLAARHAGINTILGFAPLTSFEGFDLMDQVPHLIHKHLRYYIGNHDLRVGTENCFRFIKTLADTAYDEGMRSSQAELIIGPSIGHKGHGTLPHTFQDGAKWLRRRLSA